MHYGKECYKERWYRFKTQLLVLMTNIKFFILVSWKLDCKCFNEKDTYYYRIDDSVYVAMRLKHYGEKKIVPFLPFKKKKYRHYVKDWRKTDFLVSRAADLDRYLGKVYKFRIRDDYLTFNEYTKLALLINRKYFTDCNIIYTDIIDKGINCNRIVDIRYIRVI